MRFSPSNNLWMREFDVWTNESHVVKHVIVAVTLRALPFSERNSIKRAKSKVGPCLISVDEINPPGESAERQKLVGYVVNICVYDMSFHQQRHHCCYLVRLQDLVVSHRRDTVQFFPFFLLQSPSNLIPTLFCTGRVEVRRFLFTVPRIWSFTKLNEKLLTLWVTKFSGHFRANVI